MRVAAVQLIEHATHSPRPVEEVRAAIWSAAEAGARIIVLPELSLVGYNACLSYSFPGEPVPGPWTQRLALWAEELQAVLIGGLVEQFEGHRYNTLAVVDSTGFRGRYRKVHVSTIENAYWRRGDFTEVIETERGRIGLGICADMVFPTPWREYAAQCPDLIAIAAAWPDFRTLKGFVSGRRFRDFHCHMTHTIPEKISRALGVPTILAACGGATRTSLPLLRIPIHCNFAGGSCIASEGALTHTSSVNGFEIALGDLPIGRGQPDESAWNGPWLPTDSAWIRSHFYVGETLSALAFRPVYKARKWIRSR